MNQYSWIKGFNYVPSNARNDIEIWRDYDKVLVEKELGYAKRLGFNCARVFLSSVVYRDNPQKFIENLVHFIQTAYASGIYTLPCVWDSCGDEREPSIDCDQNCWFANPGVMYLNPQECKWQETYCDALIDALEQEPGVLMWDIMNEPWMTSYVSRYEEDVNKTHHQELLDFVRYYCDYFHQKSKKLITVGVASIFEVEQLADKCDVLSFHDYSCTWKEIESIYDRALEIAQKYNKDIFCSEMCCVARANPYDVAIEIATKKEVGFFIWELMIGKSFFNNIHGIVYPDGTVRDPAIVSALSGFFRKRDGSEIDYYANAENFAKKTALQAYEWIADENSDYEKGLEILSALAFLVESAQLVPFHILPTSLVMKLQREDADRGQVKELMNKWIQVLKEDDADKTGQSAW